MDRVVTGYATKQATSFHPSLPRGEDIRHHDYPSTNKHQYTREHTRTQGALGSSNSITHQNQFLKTKEIAAILRTTRTTILAYAHLRKLPILHHQAVGRAGIDLIESDLVQRLELLGASGRKRLAAGRRGLLSRGSCSFNTPNARSAEVVGGHRGVVCRCFLSLFSPSPLPRFRVGGGSLREKKSEYQPYGSKCRVCARELTNTRHRQNTKHPQERGHTCTQEYPRMLKKFRPQQPVHFKYHVHAHTTVQCMRFTPITIQVMETYRRKRSRSLRLWNR